MTNLLSLVALLKGETSFEGLETVDPCHIESFSAGILKRARIE